MIRFRWTYAFRVDYVVWKLNLPAPNDEECLWFNLMDWQTKFTGSDYNRHRGELSHALVLGGFESNPNPSLPMSRNPPYHMPVEYLGGAIIEANKSKEEEWEFVSKAIDIMNSFRTRNAELVLLEEPGLVQGGRDWLGSVLATKLPNKD